MTSRVCSKCQIEKPLDNFYIRTDGNIYGYCKKCTILKQSEYYSTHKQQILERQKSVYDPIAKNIYFREYRKNNKDKYNVWRESHKSKRNKLLRNRYLTDPQFKIAKNLRCRLYDALNGNYKIGSAVRDLGCSINDLKLYLESKFYNHPDTNEVMSWNNYSHKGWHIDHIKPLAHFDLTDETQFKAACHYTNLQPLWAKDNYLKERKYNVAP